MGVATASAFAFHPHVLWLVALAAVAVAYGVITHRPQWRADGRQRAAFGGGLVLALVAVAWPLGDLASRWLLTALVIERLLLMLAVAPLLAIGIPDSLLVAVTRPAPIDAVVRVCSRFAPAVVVVTAISVGTLVAPAVQAQSSSAIARVVFDVLLIVAGFVLWAPVSSRLPGTQRLSALGRAAYLIVQSIVPSFLSVVWILSRHPLYPAYVRSPRVWGTAHLTDQIVAGFVAKLTTIAVLWTVAFIIVNRSERMAGEGEDTEPLRWVDVERELERSDRRRRRVTGPDANDQIGRADDA
jgi:putative membrane protein